jgi:hypothetical protein
MRRLDTLFLCLLTLVSGLNRYLFLREAQFSIDADEAIVGLMGKHLLEGGKITTFYYGQHYMGSLEAWLAGLYFSLFGISSFALKLVPFTFSLFLLWALFVLTKKIYGLAPAWICAVLAAFPAQILVDWGAKARGGFIEIVVFGALATILFLNWLETRNVKFIFWCGFLLGVGWWWNNQIVFFMTALGIYGIFAVKLKEVFKVGSAAFLSFFLGGLPFWLYNINHSFISFNTLTNSAGGKFWVQVEGFFTHSIPILAGVKRVYHETDLIPYGSYIIYLIILLLLYRIIKDSKKGLVLLLIFLATFFIFTTSSFGHLYKAPRYILPIYVAWFPFLGAGVYFWWKKSKSVGTALFFVLLGFQISSVYLGGITVPGEPMIYRDRVVRDSTELLSFLEKQNINFVRTYYWVGYKIAFESHEKVRFYPFGEPSVIRIDSYKDEGISLGLERVPLVVPPSIANHVEDVLKILEFSFKRKDLNGYVVFYELDFKRKMQERFKFTPHSNLNSDELGNLMDGDTKTRWGTRAPQTKGMTLRLKIEGSKPVCAIRLGIDDWDTDLPIAIQIDGSLGGNRFELVQSGRFCGVSSIMKSSRGGTIFFEPKLLDEVILTIEQPKPPFDWSISEIEVGC